MRRLKVTGCFTTSTLVLTVVLWAAWAGSWMTFRSVYDVGAPLGPSCALALGIASVWWRSTRPGRRTVGSLTLVCGASGACLYGLLCAAHFARKPPTRFAFLAAHPMAFPTDAGGPGLLGAIYTFPARPEQGIGAAEAELRTLGYEVRRRADRLSAFKQVGDGPYGVTVGLSPGRATGQHYWIDGDRVHSEQWADWVTVDVVEPDVVPLWIRAWLP